MKVQATSTIFRRGDLARKVSVVVALHNNAHLVEEALASVAAQTFEDIALIVVDDASTDNSQSVAKEWMLGVDAPHLTLLLLANSANAGLSITRNTGVATSSSEYCFFLDADDVILPRCIEKHLGALDGRDDCVGAFSMVEQVGNGSRLIGSNVFSRERLKAGNYIDAMAMLRREAIERLGGFHPIRHGWEAYELWLRICEDGDRLVQIPELLSCIRNHRNPILRQQINVGQVTGWQNIVDSSRDLERLHPWIETDAPRVRHGRQKASLDDALVGLPTDAAAASANEASAAAKDAPEPAKTKAADKAYTRYMERIVAKADSLNDRQPLPVNVEIDTDYTGPAHATPFDSFFSARQREDSAIQILRMLQSGIVAINPRPGVHAARGPDGALIRYRSIASENELVQWLPSSMLVHIHAFYPDVVEEMLDRFVADARNGRFLVTTTTRKNYDALSSILEKREFSRCEVKLIDNKGRDIGPFLDHVIDHAGDEDVIFHVHTKKSPDAAGDFGEKWRRSLYGTLLTQSAVEAFDDPRLGLLFPDMSRSVGWGKNRAFCEDIAGHFDRELGAHPGPIPIGNMFAVRTEVARAMRAATERFEWPREPVAYDGTVLHAIERMWPIACEHAGLEWAAIHGRYGPIDSVK